MLLAKNVLFPIKRGAGYEDAFQLACSVAKGAKGKIHAIYVIEVKLELPLDAEIGEETSRGEDALAYIEHLAKEEKCSLEAEILQARQAGPAIVQEAVNIPADLIVLGINHRHNVTGFQVGETTNYILENSRCPVLLWRNRVTGNSSSPRG